MPNYRLVDKTTNKVLLIRKMSPEVAEYKNDELAEEGLTQWLPGLGDSNTRQIRSLHQVLRSLDTEGFNEHSLHVIENYLDQEAKDKTHAVARYDVKKAEFVEVMRGLLDDRDRQAVNAFIAAQAALSFGAGIRLGLTGHLAGEAIEDGD